MLKDLESTDTRLLLEKATVSYRCRDCGAECGGGRCPAPAGGVGPFRAGGRSSPLVAAVGVDRSGGAALECPPSLEPGGGAGQGVEGLRRDGDRGLEAAGRCHGLVGGRCLLAARAYRGRNSCQTPRVAGDRGGGPARRLASAVAVRCGVAGRLTAGMRELLC